MSGPTHIPPSQQTSRFKGRLVNQFVEFFFWECASVLIIFYTNLIPAASVLFLSVFASALKKLLQFSMFKIAENLQLLQN